MSHLRRADNATNTVETVFQIGACFCFVKYNLHDIFPSIDLSSPWIRGDASKGNAIYEILLTILSSRATFNQLL